MFSIPYNNFIISFLRKRKKRSGRDVPSQTSPVASLILSTGSKMKTLYTSVSASQGTPALLCIYRSLNSVTAALPHCHWQSLPEVRDILKQSKTAMIILIKKWVL
jgi:hypothetical protein